MIRGTTATFKFKLPHELQYVTQAQVVFWQEGYAGTTFNELPKTKWFYPASELSEDSPERTSKELIVVLTATQTRAFTDKLKGRVQMNGINSAYVDDDGNMVQPGTFGSFEQLFTVYPMNDGIVDDEFDDDEIVDNDGYIILNGGKIKPTAKAGDI